MTTDLSVWRQLAVADRRAHIERLRAQRWGAIGAWSVEPREMPPCDYCEDHEPHSATATFIFEGPHWTNLIESCTCPPCMTLAASYAAAIAMAGEFQVEFTECEPTDLLDLVGQHDAEITVRTGDVPTGTVEVEWCGGLLVVGRACVAETVRQAIAECQEAGDLTARIGITVPMVRVETAGAA